MITVGDVVSLTVREHGILPLLAVYDGYTERREETGFAALVRREGLAEVAVANPAGTITSALDEAVQNALAGRSAKIIRVDGEEDLALLPCVLYAPDGALVVYGWPGRGMKAVTTDGASRRKAGQMLGLMEELS
ncbi:MAG: GTP-dependent dephospho-CoA kinase family protein [Methanoculleus sp.]